MEKQIHHKMSNSPGILMKFFHQSSSFSSCIDHEEILFCIFYSSILMTFFWFDNKRKKATIFFVGNCTSFYVFAFSITPQFNIFSLMQN